MDNQLPRMLRNDVPANLPLRRSQNRLAAIWMVLVFLITGCQPSPTPAPPTDSGPNSAVESGTASSKPESTFSFLDVTADSGVQFTYRNGEESENYSILESLGGGAGVIDLDRDGREDLIFPGGGTLDASAQPSGLKAGLFRNLGQFKFARVDDVASLDGSSFYSHGAVVSDVNNDGFDDCLITGYRGLQLYIGLGDGTFEEQSRSALLLDDKWSSSASWGDLNGDGASDLFVVHYVDWSPENHPFCKAPNPGQREICPPRQFNGVRDTLYLSNGDGSFRDATDEWGLCPQGKGLGIVSADFDGDGDLDVYVTNDTVENFLYENDGSRFNDASLLSGTSVSDRGVPEGSMGVDAFDYNRDGQLDLWVVNYENESASLYECASGMQYRHVSQRTGITAAGGGLFVGWGTCPFDVDLNGWEDIFISNGHVIRFPVNAPVHQKPLLLENRDGSRFANVAPTAGSYMTSDHAGRGSVVCDFNQDGLLDLAVSNNNQPAAILQNQSEKKGRWIGIDLIGLSTSRVPTGATVKLTSDGVTQLRSLRGGGSYASTNSRRLHFGVPLSAKSCTIEVLWPGGHRQTLETSQLDQNVVVIEKRAEVVSEIH